VISQEPLRTADTVDRWWQFTRISQGWKITWI